MPLGAETQNKIPAFSPADRRTQPVQSPSVFSSRWKNLFLNRCRETFPVFSLPEKLA
jgi:hypothetical protein